MGASALRSGTGLKDSLFLENPERDAIMLRLFWKPVHACAPTWACSWTVYSPQTAKSGKTDKDASSQKSESGRIVSRQKVHDLKALINKEFFTC